VLRVLEAWSTWSLYPPQSLLAFRTAFTGQSAADNLDGEELDCPPLPRALAWGNGD
jgi:hypothetical protein